VPGAPAIINSVANPELCHHNAEGASRLPSFAPSHSLSRFPGLGLYCYDLAGPPQTTACYALTTMSYPPSLCLCLVSSVARCYDHCTTATISQAPHEPYATAPFTPSRIEFHKANPRANRGSRCVRCVCALFLPLHAAATIVRKVCTLCVFSTGIYTR